MSIKVRPFAERVESVRDGTAPVLLRGFIRRGAFVVAVLDREVELQPRELGADGGGVFAVLEEGERRLDFGAVLRIQQEYEPDMPPGGEIEIVSEQFSRERWESALRAQGIDTTKVNLLIPPRRSVSLYFDHDGQVNGRGTLG